MHGQDGRKSAVPLCQPSAQVVGLRLSGLVLLVLALRS